MLGRELTKVHQEFLRGTAGELAQRLNVARGEFTLVLGPAIATVDVSDDKPDQARLVAEFGLMTESGARTRREAIAELSRKYRLPARQIYKTLEDAKNGLS